MLRVALRGTDLPMATLGTGERLLFGRAPQLGMRSETPDRALDVTVLGLPHCAPHVSRLLGELEVGEEIARLRWHGAGETQVASLFDAPGGARRVTLVEGMSLLLDEGENHLVVMRGRQVAPQVFEDLTIVVEVTTAGAEAVPRPVVADRGIDRDSTATAPSPGLVQGSREWYVALALAEPWLVGTDDYPRPPTNREIYERVLRWHGYAWNLERSQRVDDAIKAISSLAFSVRDDPFRAGSGRASNVRFAVGRRTAEVRLVTVDDLGRAEAAARERAAGAPPVG